MNSKSLPQELPNKATSKATILNSHIELDVKTMMKALEEKVDAVQRLAEMTDH